jgi:hypothetical protein
LNLSSEELVSSLCFQTQLDVPLHRGGVLPHAAGLLHKLHAVDPELESARFQPLNLKSDILVSKSAFSNANLYRYNAGAARKLTRRAGRATG